jgi:hypothetical protein
MSASVPPSPKLGKSQALNQAQATVTRLAALIPNVATELSPVTIYQPAQGSFSFQASTGSFDNVAIDSSYGVWVAPDVNGDGSVWYATVECFGGGGGGGGGNSSQGGGGGGGGEYACETQYPIQPGKSYAYVCGLPGSGGFSNQAGAGGVGTEGTSGSATIFDLAGVGLAGGVVANGGLGGDQTSVGIGGQGGTGSANSIHFDGGLGGSNVSGNGSDNPLSLAQTSGMFVGNTLNTNVVQAWYIMNDSNSHSATRNDSSQYSRNGTWTNLTGGSFQTFQTSPAAPAQVPAYTSAPGTYGPNQTTAQWSSGFFEKARTAAAAKFYCGGLTSINGQKFTVSGWVQASQGTWGNTPAGTFAVVAANSTNINLASFKGFGLYFFNNAGTWQLYAQVGNGTTRFTVNSGAIPPTPGTWYYVVMTFNANLLSLYVNGSLVASTTASYTSVPAGAYATAMGIDPGANANWFFGCTSNFWFANDCATSTLVSQAFGLTPPTGGSGGGASGGPSANGGAGHTGSGATGGAGGTPATQPASLVNVTTEAMGGFAGSNAGSGNASPLTPAGGPYGGGGGGSGDMVSPPAITTLTYPFTAAATYAGADAGSGPGTPYNTNQQNNPASGINTLLYAGGLPADTDSGSKNSLLLLPAGIKAAIGSATYTVTNVLLTVTNAFPSNAIESVLEVGYSNDTTLPPTYTGADLTDYVAAIEIPPGAGTVTYDLTQTGLIAELVNGTATALVMGPGNGPLNGPTFDSYNSQTGPQFYASIYGPGAYDTSGNPLFPYLTIVLEKTITVQQGSNGSVGAILISNIDNEDTPVAFVEPFAGTDDSGNQFGQGFTGQIQNFDPTQLTPGHYVPETWKTVTLPATGTFSGTIRYKKLAEVNFIVVDINVTMTTPTSTGVNTYSSGAMDSQYWPAANRQYAIPVAHTTLLTSGTDVFTPYILVGTNGVITFGLPQFSAASASAISVTQMIPLD